MRPGMNILFLFLALIITCCLFAYFIIWKRSDSENKTLPKPALVIPKKPQHTVPAETYAPVDYGIKPLEEGFATSSLPSFPRWSGPSLKVAFSFNNSAYTQYKNQNLYPSADMIDALNALPVTSEVIPDFGAHLSNFDADLVSIPWDAENTQYLQSKILWGFVTSDASRSIFTKAYIQKVLSDPANIKENESTLLYHSIFLGESAYDPNTKTRLEMEDAVAATLGQTILTTASTAVYNRIITSAQDTIAAAINKSGVTSLSSSDYALFKRTATYGELARLRNDAREAKLVAGVEALTDAERLEHDLYAARYTGFMERVSNFVGKPMTLTSEYLRKGGQAVGKYLAKFGPVAKLAAGFAAAKQFAARVAEKLSVKMAAKISQLVASSAILKTITGIIGAITGTVTAACASPAAPIMCPLAIILNAIASLWFAIDIICMALFIAIQVILPTLMTKAFENGGVCPANSKVLAQLIGDDVLYFIVTNFIPPMMVLDAFSDYLCYKPDGSVVFKQPYKIQPYMADTTLSVNKHSYANGTEPRGDYTSHKNNTDSLPEGWKVVAGIARGPCDPGTWTSSDVDMLCNISTYVPRTYAKYSHVPRTYAKGSYIPSTKPKHTYITTHTRDSRITPVDYEPCNQQWPGENLGTKTGIGTETLDCWGDSTNTFYMSCGCRRWG